MTRPLDTELESVIEDARIEFARTGVARMRHPLAPQVWAALSEGVVGLKPIANRKEFRNADSGNTLRAMSTVSKDEVARQVPVTVALYRDRGFIRVLERVVADKIFPVPVPQFVVNWMHRRGDTQGAHRDTYKYAVVLVVEAPTPGGGGAFEICDDAGDHLDALVRVEVAVGDCIIMNANQRHRVTPLRQLDSSRLVFVLGYSDSEVVPQRFVSNGPLYAPGDYVMPTDDSPEIG